jgi:hypothetical protein
MKTTERIRAVRFDNRKRRLHVNYASGKRIGVHYGRLATQLGTSDNQIQRLLDPSVLNKNLEQLYRISLLLGLELE